MISFTVVSSGTRGFLLLCDFSVGATADSGFGGSKASRCEAVHFSANRLIGNGIIEALSVACLRESTLLMNARIQLLSSLRLPKRDVGNGEQTRCIMESLSSLSPVFFVASSYSLSAYLMVYVFRRHITESSP